MNWTITTEGKSIIVTNGTLKLKRSSATKLWASLIVYFYKWLKSEDTEFTIRKERGEMKTDWEYGVMSSNEIDMGLNIVPFRIRPCKPPNKEKGEVKWEKR